MRSILQQFSQTYGPGVHAVPFQLRAMPERSDGACLPITIRQLVGGRRWSLAVVRTKGQVER